MKVKDIIIDLILVIAFFIICQSLILKPQLKTNMIEEATTALEKDIDDKNPLQDHYIIYDDGKENLIAKSAKGISQGISVVIEMVVLFIGDLISLLIG